MHTKATTLRLVYFIALILLCFACNEDTIEPKGEGSISGVVLHASTNQPIAGVSISTSPATTAVVTDAEGKFILRDVPGGNYAISAKKAGLKAETVSVAVIDGKETQATLVLGDSNTDQAAPGKPSNPDPAEKATNISIADTLRWMSVATDGDSTFYDVYLYESGSTEKKKVAEAIADTSVVVTDLKYNTTYFWQVIAKDKSSNVTNGPDRKSVV